MNDNHQQPDALAPMIAWAGPALDALESEWIPLPDVARGLGKTYITAYRWAKAGRIKAYEEPGSKRLIVHVTDLVAFLHPKPVER